MKVYFVRTINDIDKFGTTGGRTVGYYETLEEAKKCVSENWGDIYEDGYYKYAVIEGVEPGLYRSSDPDVEPLFYKWVGSKAKGKYRPIKKPRVLKHVVGFTIG